MFSSIVVGILGFYYCSLETNASSLGPPLLSGPDVALDEDIVEFECKVLHFPAESILLQVFKQGDRSKSLAFYTSLDGSPAKFPMVVGYTTHEGYLECVASVQNNSLIPPTVSRPHYLKVVVPVKGATLAVQSGAVEIFEGKMLVLRCNVTSGNYVSYSWLLDDQLPLPASSFHYTHQELFIYRTMSKHSGNYLCVATNQFNDTDVYTATSPKVLITVKELVSSPDISYRVHKENSQNYSAWVTCESSRGTLPITFSLYNMDTLVANQTVGELYAKFTVPLVLNHHVGLLRCQAENGDRTAYSKLMALQVVPVGGPVTMRYDYSTGEDFSVTDVRFYCRAANGTHPRFHWFLNGTLLEQDPHSFYVMLHQSAQQSVLLLPMDRRSTGTYHCEVSDLFDSTTVIQSEKMYIDKEVLNRLSSVVVAVVFSCFGLLLTCVLTCCCAGVIFRRRQDGNQSMRNIKTESMVLAYGDDLDLEEYRENADFLTAAGINDSDQGSEASTDEWPETDGIKELNTDC